MALDQNYQERLVPDAAGNLPRVVLTQQVAPASYNDRYPVDYGSGLTPQVLTSALQLANTGQMFLLTDILEEVREKDAHLAALISKREVAVSGAEFSCLAEDPTDERAKEIAAWTEREIKSLENIDTIISHLQGGLYYQRAVCEQIWIPVQGRLRLLSVTPLHPRRFSYAALEDWRLRLWDQTGNEKAQDLSAFPGIPLNAFPAGKWIAHTPYVRGGYPTREGLGRTVVWWAMIKRFAVRDWVAFCEWCGRGIRIGTYKTGTADAAERATQEDVNALENALNNMGSSLQVILPDTTELAIHEVKSAVNPPQETLLRCCDAQMSKCVLGNTLTTDAGEKGARSLGDTQKEEQIMMARGDAKAVATTMRRDMATPLVRFRYGPTAPVPLVKFHIEASEDPVALSMVIKNLSQAGVAIPMSYVYTKFNIPAPKAGEAIAVPRKFAPADDNDNIARTGDGIVSEAATTQLPTVSP